MKARQPPSRARRDASGSREDHRQTRRRKRTNGGTDRGPALETVTRHILAARVRGGCSTGEIKIPRARAAAALAG